VLAFVRLNWELGELNRALVFDGTLLKGEFLLELGTEVRVGRENGLVGS
jgi:hypothetical protein